MSTGKKVRLEQSPCARCWGQQAAWCDNRSGMCREWWEWARWSWPLVCEHIRALAKSRNKDGGKC